MKYLVLWMGLTTDLLQLLYSLGLLNCGISGLDITKGKLAETSKREDRQNRPSQLGSSPHLTI